MKQLDTSKARYKAFLGDPVRQATILADMYLVSMNKNIHRVLTLSYGLALAGFSEDTKLQSEWVTVLVQLTDDSIHSKCYRLNLISPATALDDNNVNVYVSKIQDDIVREDMKCWYCEKLLSSKNAAMTTFAIGHVIFSGIVCKQVVCTVERDKYRCDRFMTKFNLAKAADRAISETPSAQEPKTMVVEMKIPLSTASLHLPSTPPSSQPTPVFLHIPSAASPQPSSVVMQHTDLVDTYKLVDEVCGMTSETKSSDWVLSIPARTQANREYDLYFINTWINPKNGVDDVFERSTTKNNNLAILTFEIGVFDPNHIRWLGRNFRDFRHAHRQSKYLKLDELIQNNRTITLSMARLLYHFSNHRPTIENTAGSTKSILFGSAAHTYPDTFLRQWNYDIGPLHVTANISEETKTTTLTSPATATAAKPKIVHKCVVCHQPSTSRCGGCKLTHYCGPVHQRSHWSGEDGIHKYQCQDLKKRAIKFDIV